MVNESKSKIVLRNTVMGVFNNVALVLLNLITRKLFLQYIGIEYLSIGQVINNILSILAFSELGVANSVLYMLYKPVSENDERKITRIIGTYKKLNKTIGCTIFVFGLLCMPFLHYFIKTSISMNTVKLIFLMNLFYSVSTYFCSYRQVLINANQKNYIVSKVSLVINFCSIIIQSLAIYFTHCYILYLAITIVMGVLINIVTYFIAGYMFPYIVTFKKDKLDKYEARTLAENVKSMFSVKICGIVINNTDNILVSLFDTLKVGFISNYTIVTSRLRGIITVFHNSVIYSLGIASVQKTPDEKYFLFKKVILVNTFIAGFTSLLIGVLWNDFIVLWIGSEYVVSDVLMFSLLINYMWSLIIAPIWMFRDTNGLFTYVKKMLLINALLNLIISFILGKMIGVSGVYYATIIADIMTDFWFDSKLIYNKLFKRNDYWKYCAFVLANIFFIASGTILINRLCLGVKISILTFIVKAIITGMIYIVVFLCVFGRSDVVKNIWSTMIKPKIQRMG